MKKLILILFILLTVFLRGEVVVDSVSIDTLSNGVQVVRIWDNSAQYVYISFFARYHPITSSYYKGRDRIFAYLTGAEILDDNIFVRSVVCDSDAVDSSLRFIYSTVFESTFSPQKIKRAILFLKQPDSLFERITRLTSYSRSSPLNKPISEFMTPEQINNFPKELYPNNMVIVIRGRLPAEMDSSVSIVFGKLSSENIPISNSGVVPFLPRHNKGLYFVNRNDSALFVGFSLPIKHFFKDEIFKVLFLKYYFKHFYPNGKFVFHSSVFGDYLGFYFSADSMTMGLSNLEKRFSALRKNYFSDEFSDIKTKMIAEYDSLLSNPWYVNAMIYRQFINGADIRAVLAKDNRIKSLGIKELSIGEFVKNPTLIVVGNELLLGCELLKLSKKYDINFTDEKIYRYKILRKGFDAWTVINRYVNFVRPERVPRSLHYTFSGIFFTDSTFLHLKGDIWKTSKGLFRYETYVMLQDSAVLHSLVLFDGHQWIDSAYYGREIMDSSQVQTFIRQRYILSEIYYKRLGYEPVIICEPELMAQNIFKVKVKTPTGIYFYDFYDMATREKLKTIINNKDGWMKSIYYKDYTRVRQGKNNFKIPFVVIEQTPYYTFTYQIDGVSFRHIPRRVFSANYKRK